MKLIDSKVELLQQESGLEGAFKQIERCGRTCYKSEDHITEDSYKRFVEGMIKNGHTAMLEHGTIYLEVPSEQSDIVYKYEKNQYSRVGEVNGNPGDWCFYPITTNYRVIIQNGWEDDLKYICNPTEHHVKRYTFRITCDRGVSHEIVRHRHMSFAQESTRYCNYSKDKFGNELTFIKPSWYTSHGGFERFLNSTEELYISLLDQGKTPQEARAILPNCLKTEICVTGFEDDWEHFLNLRLIGTTGKPHPDMQRVAQLIADCFNSKDIHINPGS